MKTEEYCWAITHVAGRSRCGRAGSCVMKCGFQLYCLCAYIYGWPYVHWQTKLNIFNTHVKAVLLYGCESWKHSKSITAKLQVFIDKCPRKVLRIFWPDQITNKELWKRTKQPRIDLQIRKHKWGWPGHTLRKPSDDIARQALEWNPQGKQGRGRSRNTWRRTMLEEAKGINP